MIKFLNWILSYFGLSVINQDLFKNKLVIDEPKYTSIILHHMRRFDDLAGASGEWKAHQVYAALIKKLPNVPHQQLRLEMELVYAKYFRNA